MMLYLVRHGQSVGNEKKLFFGWSDHPLTDLGRAQARQAADKLREVSFSRCYASDLARAWDTACICTEGRGVTPEPCPGLREQNMGAFEDTTFEESREKFGPLVERLVFDWFHTTPPDGESPDAVAARVGECVDRIVAGGEDALLVGHNGSLSLVLKHLGLAGEDVLLTPDWFFQHGAYTAIRVDKGGAELVCFNR